MKSIMFLNDWMDNARKCKWLYDQGPFANTVLQRAHKSKHKRYSDFCCRYTRSSHYKNMCYSEKMNALGYPVNKRAFSDICLIPEANRWNMHDSGQMYEKDDEFYHAHDIKNC